MKSRSEIIADGFQDALKLQRLMAQYPIAFHRLWHKDKPKTSQRVSVQQMLHESIRCGLIVGGNRSGKTEAGAMIAACVAMGKADPGAKKWLQANDLPDLKIKDRQGRVS